MISKTEEILGDIDIKNFTVSPLNHNACTDKPTYYRVTGGLTPGFS